MIVTMERFHTTVTERGSFRSCRRQWYLENVLRLRHRNRIPWHFLFGDAIHEGLAAYYTGNKRRLLDARDAFLASWEQARDQLRDQYGGLYDAGVGDEWIAMRDKGDAMLVYYDEYDRANPFWDDVLEVDIEERSFVPILDNDTGIEAMGTPLLSGKIDLVVHKKGSGIWIVDHKTAASAYDARALDVDDQLTGYAYIWWRISGEVPRGALYNALIKEPPHEPIYTTTGALSKRKDQRTTYELYVKAMEEIGIPLDDPDYESVLKVLKDKGWGQFFLRDGLERNIAELESFEYRLWHEYKDMTLALGNEGYRYPNPSQRTCPGCGMIALCQSIEEGGDAEYIRETMYEVSDPRHEIPEGV